MLAPVDSGLRRSCRTSMRCSILLQAEEEERWEDRFLLVVVEADVRRCLLNIEKPLLLSLRLVVPFPDSRSNDDDEACCR